MSTDDVDRKRAAREHQMAVMADIAEQLDSLATREAKVEIIAFLATTVNLELTAPKPQRRDPRYAFKARS